MHLADGVLSTPAVIGTSVVAGALVLNSLKDVDNEDIPRVSIMTATFFVFALMSFKAGPSSVHPLLGGLIGIILGGKAPLAIFIGLVLQAGIFQHGGFTSLGMNTLMVSVPALAGYLFFKLAMGRKKNLRISAGLSAFISVILTVLILVTVLALTSENYKEVIGILVLGHIPLAIGEGVLTGLVIGFLGKARPEILSQYRLED